MTTTSSEILLKSMSKDDLDMIQPCFIFDSELFKKNLERFYDSFQKVFGYKFRISYSTKTNSSPVVLETLYKSGMMIEVVSPHELNLAYDAGFVYSSVVYNGVIPDPRTKFEVAALGGIVNVENYNELKEIARIAKARNKCVEVGLRVNIKIDDNRKWESRFGVKPYTEQFAECMACQNEYLKIVGIHSHIHGCRTLDFWRLRAEMLGSLAKEYSLKYIDFGSNMFGFMDSRLADQFDCQIPTPEDYARTIHDGLKMAYGDEELPTVIVEPGTPVVANTVSLLGRVENISERGFDTIATASCSVYDFGFFHGSDKHPPMDVIHMSDGKHYDDVEIFGYACTEDDTVCKSYTGNLAVGDYLVFRNLGAYANSLSSDFIKPKMKTYDLKRLNRCARYLT